MSGSEVLFDMGVESTVGGRGVGRRGQPGKKFRPFHPDQPLLMSPVLDEWLPEDHLARFVAELVDQVLDLSPFYDSYVESRGFPPHDPRLMVRLLVYGYCTGVRSSRGIERRCVDDVAFRYLAGGQFPDFRSVAKFRRRHLGALEGLLVQTLQLAQAAGLARLGRVALDGTKLRAAASKHKAMSWDRLVSKEEQLEAEVAALQEQVSDLLTEAEACDAAEDARLGQDNRDEDLPGELARRETRLGKVQQAKVRLQAEAEERARARAQARERRRQDRTGQVEEDQVNRVGQEAAAGAQPKPKAQSNFTDPDSRIVKNSDGAYVQSYNGQAVVDEDHQIIVAADITDCASDCPSLDPMLDQAKTNAGQAPGQALADAGYCSEDNLNSAQRRQDDEGTETLIATGRQRHSEQPDDQPTAPADSDEQTSPSDAVAAEPDLTPKQKMTSRLRSEQGRAAYARRKVIVEPVFGQMRTRQNGKQLLLRGSDGARGEWRLLAACHNIHKLFANLGSAALAT